MIQDELSELCGKLCKDEDHIYLYIDTLKIREKVVEVGADQTRGVGDPHVLR